MLAIKTNVPGVVQKLQEMMIYKQYANAGKADAVKKWINWVLKDGQQYNDDLNYTKIPGDVVNRVLQTVNSTVK